MSEWKQDVQKKVDDTIFNKNLSSESKLKYYLHKKLDTLFKDDSEYGLVRFTPTEEDLELKVLGITFFVRFNANSTFSIIKSTNEDTKLLGKLIIISSGNNGVYFVKEGDSERLFFTEQLLDELLKETFNNK